MSSSMTRAKFETDAVSSLRAEQQQRNVESRIFLVYLLVLVAAISLWLIAIAAPLRLDETGTFWQISDGLSQIWSRQFWGLSFPAYPYILWLSTHLIGTSEAALRLPSVAAMLGAAYLLYRAAREIFPRDIAILTTILFALHPIVAFEAIDARPYAFGILASNAAIFLLFRLRYSRSSWLATLFGFAAVSVLYFHFLFVTLAPALAICLVLMKKQDRGTLLKQMGIAVGVFALGCLPLIPGLRYLLHTTGTHVYESAPHVFDLAWTIAPGWLLPVFLIAVVAVAAISRSTQPRATHEERINLLLCMCLGLVPLLILFGVSAGTSIHTFAARHRLDAIPGIALCWGWMLSRFASRTARLVFCLALVAIIGVQQITSMQARTHLDTMKYALRFVEKNASVDDAPVMICSGFVESNFYPMPAPAGAKDNYFFSPLTYYRLSVPVVPLPQQLNEQTIELGSKFIGEAAQKRQRFLAVAYLNSAKTLDWITEAASPSYTAHKLGVFQDVEVLEFVPR